MGLEGFTNNASGGMSPGDELYAKTFNKLASSADKAQVGPSDGVLFTANNGGIGMYIPQQTQEQTQQLVQQFQIFVEPYFIADVDTGFSIIRVVKGEVVWCPKLLQEESPIPVPLPPSCTTQTTIENWFALPTFPIIDDEKSIFIGDGGIRVPKVAGIPIGIFIFKATNLPFDLDPIIVAVPDYVPSCPVVFPGTPPVPLAFWEVVKVGSVIYVAPDPEADPPIDGGWEITQNFIGSMTLPGDGGGTSTPQSVLPAQLGDGAGRTIDASPFQCFIENINGFRYLRIATGTVSYSSSNMPLISGGAFTHTKQAWFKKIQICPSGSRTSYEEMFPNPYFDPDPTFSNQTMEEGGGYRLFDTNDPVILYAFKWDVDVGVPPFSESSVVNTGLPTLGLFAQSNPADINKVEVDPGPSIYEQTMNIQKMAGYDHLPAPFPDSDWGHCHTTWLNPRKIGYNYKAIATIIPAGSGVFECYVAYEQPGVPGVCNTIQNINLLGEAMAGAIVFSYNGIPSPIPFSVIWDYTSTSSIGPDALNLFRSLNAIPELTGNVQVSGNDGFFYVTFVNALQGLPINLITANTSGVVRYNYRFELIQYHTGNLDLTTPMQMGMTQLMNKANLTEADDPYNQNKNSDPAWDMIVNRDDCKGCKDFAGDVTTDGVFNMTGATANNPDFSIIGGCIPEPPEPSFGHPFKVSLIFSADGMFTYSIQPGTVNNETPGNILSDITVSLMTYEVWVKVPYAAPNFPATSGFEWNIGSDVPPDTDSEGYVRIATVNGDTITQYITGSLWGDRIKLGSLTADYYFARV